MSFVWSTAVRDLKRRLRDPLALLLWVGIPVVVAGLLAIVTGDDGAAPTARVVVVDRDQTFLSQSLLQLGGGGQGPGGGVLDLEEMEPEAAREVIDRGEATAMLVVPDGFADAILYGTPAELTLVTNPAQQILPGIVREMAEILVEGGFYVHRLLGEELALLAGAAEGGDAPDDATVGAVASGINARMTSLDGILFPPVLQLEVREPEGQEGSADPGFGVLFLPGLLFMAVLFIAQGLSDDIWQEREAGTLRRVMAAPRSGAAFLAGKVLAGALLCGLVALAAVCVTALLFDVAVTRLPLSLAWCVYGGTALLVYFLLVQMYATSQRGGYVLTTVLVFPLIMLGGSIVPFEAMPGWMAEAGRWTPNGQAVLRLKQMLFGTPEWPSLVKSVAAIGLPALAGFVLAVRRLEGGFARA
jgi:ABC-type Na+ efflux pump permease subunit